MSRYCNFTNFIKNFDYTSPEPKIRIFGERSYQTIYGGITTIITLSILLAAAIYFMIEFLFQNKMTIIENTDITNTPYLNLSDTPIMVYMQNSSSVPISRRAWTVSFAFWTTEQIEYENRTIINNTTKQDIEAEICEEKHFGKHWDIFKDIAFLNDYYCLPQYKYNLSLYGTYGDTQPHSLLGIYINRCVNNSSKNITNCFDDDLIEKSLQSSFINLKYLDYKTDNYKIMPAVPYVYSNAIPISLSIYKREYFYLSNVRYNSDNNLFLKYFQEYPYYTSAQQTSFIDFGAKNSVPGNFAYVSILMSNQIKVVNRVYNKIPNVLAEIGGFAKLIKIFIDIFNEYFYKSLFYLKLISSYFTFRNGTDNLENYNSRNNSLDFLIKHDQSNSCGTNLHNLNNFTNSKVFSSNTENLIPLSNNKLKYKLRCIDYFCPFIKTQRNRNFKILTKSINTKISIDHIINKIKELDKIKLILFNQTQISIFNTVPYKIIYLDDKGYICNFNKFEDSSSQYKISDYSINSYNNLEALENYQKLISSPSEKTDIDLKLIALVDKTSL
jgi:hypothetical protein